MATYGTGNLVGYGPGAYQEIPPKRRSVLPSAALGTVAGINLKRAVYPNVQGHIDRAERTISDLDAKANLEQRYKRPSAAAFQDIAEQRARAVGNANWVKANVRGLHTPIRRVKRAGIGLAALAGAAALFPRKRKNPDVPLG